MVGRWVLCCFLIFQTVIANAVVLETKSVSIGGIRQWLSMKGQHESDPVLLFLHGGPGSSAMVYGEKFTAELQKNFIVVQWDQRESGKTLTLNASPVPLTVALFESDALEVIDYLRTHFSKEKVYLMGHSWGGFLGLMIAAKHPDRLHCYFAINPMVNQAESERLTLQMMKDKAAATGNADEVKELSQVEIPFKNGVQLFYHRKWLAVLMGQKSNSQSFVEPWAKKWLALFNEASAINCLMTAPEIPCPVYFLLGDHDYQTYFRLTEEYYGLLKCPEKKIFWFKGSAHVFLFAERKKIQEIILQQLLSGSAN